MEKALKKQIFKILDILILILGLYLSYKYGYESAYQEITNGSLEYCQKLLQQIFINN